MIRFLLVAMTIALSSTSILLAGNDSGGVHHQQFMQVESKIYRDLETRTRLRESVGLEPRTKIPGTDIDVIRNNDDLFTDPTNFLILPKSNNP